jgi:hypothetical protein
MGLAPCVRRCSNFTLSQIESAVHPKIPTDLEGFDRWRLWLDYGDEPYGAQCVEFQLSHPPRLIPTPLYLLSPMVFRVPATPAYARRAVVWARRGPVQCPADILDLASSD